MKSLIAELKRAKEEGKTVFICGNGGSASTANHFANDLVKMCGIKALSLCSNEAVVMAYANDDGYETIFASQLRVFFEEGDLLVTLSGSGTSKNVVMAKKYVTSRGGFVWSFPTMSSYNCDMQRAEDKHLILSHKITTKLCQN